MPSNWENFRYVLTLLESSSLRRAAKTLRCEPTEVLVRVQAYEDSVGQPLFDRIGDLMELTPSGRRIVSAAREVMSSMEKVGQGAAQKSASGVAPIAISTLDCINQYLLVDCMARIPEGTPLPVVSFMHAQEVQQLDHLGTELVVRPGHGMADELDSEVAGYFDFAVYERADARNSWLGLSGVLERAPAAQWYRDHVPVNEITLSSDSFVTLAMMVQAGVGRAVLPSYVGDQFAWLKRYDIELTGKMIPLHIGNHPDLSGIRRLKQLKRQVLTSLRHSERLSSHP
ncbi:DNA-binding transcriptional regulator OxyR [Thalassovita autumnalis]|uniref:DNA-binding transcriptional regulator OxyR n=1 Tax=Thalassovita autumnalis TaxID=2072972 RepID=A0A0P1FUU3_9RHOB|nr:LysR family transcriptional regulator [Thalassovita autumnalis]CUH65983.1 DNA-binding transcriptional regulator OxyR [Thalassovita autumnalis]CUH72523.1 DNA-binding transcriptional regulator OxyR [Thalassovita autumnalis]